jgi:sterol desaturase/sphingolipid hydroxylase (fatty acid hydroxylase superfamily)
VAVNRLAIVALDFGNYFAHWFLESILITPRLHRLHHVPETDSCNLGTVFTFWDRLRGTLMVADVGPETALGVVDEIETYPQRWADQLIEPPKRIVRAISTRIVILRLR